MAIAQVIEGIGAATTAANGANQAINGNRGNEVNPFRNSHSGLHGKLEEVFDKMIQNPEVMKGMQDFKENEARLNDQYIMNKLQMADNEQYNKRAEERAYQYGEKAADAAFKRNQQWFSQYESPEAMRRMLEEAGYNPNIIGGISGGTGAGGTQGTASAGASTGGTMDAPNLAAQKGSKAQMLNATTQALQASALTASQIKLNESAANKNNADAEYTSGTQTELGQKSIAKLIEETENIRIKTAAEEQKMELDKADQLLRERQTALNEAVGQKNIEKMSEEIKLIGEQINSVTTATLYTLEQIESAKRRNQIDEATKATMIQQAKADLQNTVKDTALKVAEAITEYQGQKLTQKQIWQIEDNAELAAERLKFDKEVASANYAYEGFEGPLNPSQIVKVLIPMTRELRLRIWGDDIDQVNARFK